MQVPADLELAYFSSLAKLPLLVAAACERVCDADFLACMLAAVAVAKGQSRMAKATLEMTPTVADEFMEWFFAR